MNQNASIATLKPGARRYQLRELRWTVVREAADRAPAELSGPAAVVNLGRELYREFDDDREHFLVVFLNTQNHYVGHHWVSHGLLSSSLVAPLEVFGPALREGAASVVLLHNHPSGDPAASREDIRLTRDLVAGGHLLKLPVRDHVILGAGNGRYVSLAETGVM